MVNKRKLRAVIVEKNTTQELLANELNIDRSTFSRKMSVNGKFTVEEANEIVKSLGLTKDEALAIFFADTFA
ncbi:phage repressor [Streptococcus pseudoporcinus]|uniref:Phage repressor n=1 Tax=Streptococcus pseudoporcinus TaxID=361101 RepID=A0A4U9XNS5_9STRE|nr:XRE family transcriptional regulator [Streptococcus pseudoporcinus]VTS14739.1 phage repressor [Streptococcus pseudoporcinus]